LLGKAERGFYPPLEKRQPSLLQLINEAFFGNIIPEAYSIEDIIQRSFG